MKVRELIFKDMGKNLIRTILDDHRDAALYKAAANQFLDMICYEKSPYYNTGVELIDKLGNEIDSLKKENLYLKQENVRLTKLVNQLNSMINKKCQ